jgi:antibiotic biosynthesis monooxygenase (ABM) superfamily enzyme
MIVTVFRSRLKPDLREDYVALANRMKELAQTIPGYISHKDFYATDGERVAVVEFASLANQS